MEGHFHPAVHGFPLQWKLRRLQLNKRHRGATRPVPLGTLGDAGRFQPWSGSADFPNPARSRPALALGRSAACVRALLPWNFRAAIPQFQCSGVMPDGQPVTAAVGGKHPLSRRRQVSEFPWERIGFRDAILFLDVLSGLFLVAQPASHRATVGIGVSSHGIVVLNGDGLALP